MSNNLLDWTGISYPFRIENGSIAKSKSILNSKDGTSQHIGESIKTIVNTFLGEWITKSNIGTKFRSIVFNTFNSDFDTYIIHNLTNAIETQDKRVKISDLNIERHSEENLIKIIVKWDINPDIVKNYINADGYITFVDININDNEGFDLE